MTSSVMPAFSGREGPGEMTMPCGSRDDDVVDADLVVANDLDVRAELGEVLVEVERERVVVVEQQDAQARAGALVAGPDVGRSLARRGHARAPSVSTAADSASASAASTAPALAATSADSRAGTESATMPAPAWTWATPSIEHHAPDRDRGLDVVGCEEPDRAAVGTTPLLLERRDRLHRADLRRPRQRARGEHRADRVERVAVRPEPALDLGHDVHDVGVALDAVEQRHVDAARPRRRARRRCGRGRRASRAPTAPSRRRAGRARAARSRRGVVAARPGAGDRPRRDDPVADTDEQLG